MWMSEKCCHLTFTLRQLEFQCLACFLFRGKGGGLAKMITSFLFCLTLNFPNAPLTGQTGYDVYSWTLKAEEQRCVPEFIDFGSSQSKQKAPRMEQRYWSTKRRLTNESTAPSGFKEWELQNGSESSLKCQRNVWVLPEANREQNWVILEHTNAKQTLKLQWTFWLKEKLTKRYASAVLAGALGSDII